MPRVIWIHPGRIFVQSYQEDVLLLVGSVECEHTHHDEVGKGGGVKKHQHTRQGKHDNLIPQANCANQELAFKLVKEFIGIKVNHCNEP